MTASPLYIETLGDGVPLVLLHGWAMHSGIWRAFGEALSTTHRVLLVDLPGHGRSPWPEGCGKSCLLSAVKDAVPPGAIWVGWSLGGSLALRAHLDDPAAVPAAIVLAGSPCFVANDSWAAGMPVDRFETFTRGIQFGYGHALQRFLTLQLWGLPGAREWTRAALRDLTALPPSSEGLANGLIWLRETDLRARLGAGSVRVQWILGRRDVLVPAALAEALPQWSPNARVEVLDTAAHMPFLTHRDEVLAAMRSFLAAVRVPTT